MFHFNKSRAVFRFLVSVKNFEPDKKTSFRKICEGNNNIPKRFHSVWKFLEFPCLVDNLIDFLDFSTKILKYWVGVHTVVAVINVDACPFSAFSDLTCHLENTGIGVFWLHLLHCYAWFFILFHLAYMSFSQSTHWLCLSLETLSLSIIMTGWPILVELVDLVNFAIIFLS